MDQSGLVHHEEADVVKKAVYDLPLGQGRIVRVENAGVRSCCGRLIFLRSALGKHAVLENAMVVQ